MNILFLSSQYPPAVKGGGEISTHLTARGLITIGHHVQIVTEGTEHRPEKIDGVPVLRLPLPLTAKPLLERRHAQEVASRLVKAVDFTAYDIVHAHDFRSALALAELALPQAVVTVRDYAQISGDTNYLLRDGSIPERPMSWRANLLSNRIAEAPLWRKPFRAWQYLHNMRYRQGALATLRHQIFISHAQRRAIAQHQNLAGVHTGVVYNPVSPDYLDRPVQVGKPGHVLYIGRVEMYKGVGLLLAAWPEVVTYFPDAQLTIVGQGAQRKEYELYAAKQSMPTPVTFIDHMPYDHMIDLYDQASIIVSPHMWIEPFGRSLVEAMARGKLVVAANAGGPAELITDGQTGFLFEHGSQYHLSQNLLKALQLPTNQRTLMQAAARHWVTNHLTIDKSAKRQYSFYTTVKEQT
jgi:alpha-maltose-1-phosphate synthase